MNNTSVHSRPITQVHPEVSIRPRYHLSQVRNHVIFRKSQNHLKSSEGQTGTLRRRIWVIWTRWQHLYSYLPRSQVEVIDYSLWFYPNGFLWRHNEDCADKVRDRSITSKSSFSDTTRCSRLQTQVRKCMPSHEKSITSPMAPKENLLSCKGENRSWQQRNETSQSNPSSFLVHTVTSKKISRSVRSSDHFPLPPIKDLIQL